MKVYELMNALADMPSGANVVCASTLTIKELKSGSLVGDDENGNTLFSVVSDIDDAESVDNTVYLNC